jgi:hypothetical protein
MFKNEEIVDPFRKILKARKREKMCDNCVKLKFFESRTKSFQIDHRNLVVISEELNKESRSIPNHLKKVVSKTFHIHLTMKINFLFSK